MCEYGGLEISPPHSGEEMETSQQTQPQQSSGILGKILDWLSHPVYSEGTSLQWAAGLVAILAVCFLWSTVVKQTVEV